MTPTRNMSGFAFAFALLLSVLAPGSARAQGFDFLWGGGSDFGGGRHLVNFSSQYKPGQIIVSFSDRRLYHVIKPGQAMTYPVAVPTGEARWQGTTFVSDKRVNPAWTPTPEMIAKNPRLPSWVPGGHPLNPLGVRAMYLGSSAYRIHGTDAPWTIGQAVSHGCIRMTNEDVLDLYPRVPVGTHVTVTWQRFTTTAALETSSAGSGEPSNADRPQQRKYYRSNTSSRRSTLPPRKTGTLQKAAQAQ
jgi:lipoprotein-anchoring transpeptidase ErfK/SrfK